MDIYIKFKVIYFGMDYLGENMKKRKVLLEEENLEDEYAKKDLEMYNEEFDDEEV